MNKRNIWVKKFRSSKEAEAADLESYLKMSPAERIRTVQVLREIWFKINGGKNGRCPKRLPRFVKIIQPA